MRSAGRKKHVQLTLDQARKPEPGKRGGWRPNAGRPKGRTKVAHTRREHVAPSHPQHVTLRLVRGLPSLRRKAFAKIVRDAVAEAHREGFRIVEFNVESNHLHLLIEASSMSARSRGIQGFKVRVARRVNAALGRKGALFAERYHARALKTPREVRHALRYVLNNARHHAGSNVHYDETWIDPFSSAAWFGGWVRPIEVNTQWKRELLELPRPTAPPTVWLLTTGWRRHGALRFDEVPGIRSGHHTCAPAGDSFGVR